MSFPFPFRFLTRIQELYDIEDRARNMTDEQRLALRQADATRRDQLTTPSLCMVIQRPPASASRCQSAHFDYDIREVFFKTRKGNPYRVLFTILDDEVLVLRVRGPGQDYVSEAELPERPGRE